MRSYHFYEEYSSLEEMLDACALNNLEYWDELCESNPSVAKLRNLAALYHRYDKEIVKQYSKTMKINPQSMEATSLYLSYLMNVGINLR